MIVQTLSDITIEALENERNDEVDIIALGLYLELGLVKTMLEKNSLLIKRTFNVHDDTDFTGMRMANCREAIEEIILDFREQQQSPWLVKWMEVCGNEFKNKAVYYVGDLHDDILSRTIIYLVHKHLEIPGDGALLLYDITRYILAAGLLNDEK